MISKRIISLVAALMIAGATAVPAFAWGERKNQAPFVQAPVTHPFVSGEPKNEPPFTNPVGDAPTVIVAGTHTGFKWGDAAIYAGLAMEPASGFGVQPAGGSWHSGPRTRRPACRTRSGPTASCRRAGWRR